MMWFIRKCSNYWMINVNKSLKVFKPYQLRHLYAWHLWPIRLGVEWFSCFSDVSAFNTWHIDHFKLSNALWHSITDLSWVEHRICWWKKMCAFNEILLNAKYCALYDMATSKKSFTFGLIFLHSLHLSLYLSIDMS